MSRVLLAGGGLANCLIAWWLRRERPDARLTIVEQGAALGGNHTWSFHEGDLTAAQHERMAPLVTCRWPGQAVRFPALARRIASGYSSITSGRLHHVLGSDPGLDLRLGVRIESLQPDGAVIEGGVRLDADLVIDGRGTASLPGCTVRWQKFLGRGIELAGAHGLTEPVLMDATVAQHDGFRFVYLLPFGPRELLVEDTYYSDTPDLDADTLRRRLDEYVAAAGWRTQRVLREETGVLPIVLDGDPEAYWRECDPAVPRSGMRAMLFHHTTGYSLPEAVRLAGSIAATELRSAPVAALVRARAAASWRSQRFFRLLNRLMFEAATPAERYRTLQHFYGCSEPLIGRFYAGRLRWFDALRLLSGPPPVPVRRALACLLRSRPDVGAGERLAPRGSA